jgi:A/G-specific adenine glycosylase
MLQQTRTAVVEPAYVAFLAAFPDLEALAAASEDDVLSHWSGLGYYSRARALHRAARQIRSSGGSTFPSEPEAARALPGVGAYTAAAVLSIAYGAPVAAVDGNVVRVLSRLERLARPDGRGEPHRTLADRLLCLRRPGDWNQALMELGETLCKPVSPRCQECPVARWCRARRENVVALHPPPKPRRAPERLTVRMTLLRDRSGRLLLERGAFPYLRHLWLPPTNVEEPAKIPRDGCGRATAKRGPSFKHNILHREFQVHVEGRVLATAELRRHVSPPANGAERRLFAPGDLASIGRSALLSKALAVWNAAEAP